MHLESCPEVRCHPLYGPPLIAKVLSRTGRLVIHKRAAIAGAGLGDLSGAVS
jgi:hypothetical protein